MVFQIAYPKQEMEIVLIYFGKFVKEIIEPCRIILDNSKYFLWHESLTFQYFGLSKVRGDRLTFTISEL